MEWVCFVLIIGTMLYIGGIVVDYLNYDAHVRPQVAKLKKHGLELVELGECETLERDRAQDRADIHRPAIEELHHNIEMITQKIKTEKVRKNRLEMALLKSSLKHTRRVNIALA